MAEGEDLGAPALAVVLKMSDILLLRAWRVFLYCHIWEISAILPFKKAIRVCQFLERGAAHPCS